MADALQFTARQGAALAPVVEAAAGLQALHVNSFDKAAAAIAEALAKRGKDMTNELFGVHIAWLLGLDAVFDRANELADLLGVERR